jgi:hypothetical protein
MPTKANKKGGVNFWNVFNPDRVVGIRVPSFVVAVVVVAVLCGGDDVAGDVVVADACAMAWAYVKPGMATASPKLRVNLVMAATLRATSSPKVSL